MNAEYCDEVPYHPRSPILKSVFVAVPMLLLSAQLHAADQDNVRAQLAAALVCQGEVAEIVSNLAEKPPAFSSGIAATGFGEEMSYKAVAILEKPLMIGKASTHAVVSESESTHAEFLAFTYAKFSGDYRDVVAELGLKAEAADAEVKLGKFVLPQADDEVCPKTIILTPGESGHFLLGCGWCNG